MTQDEIIAMAREAGMSGAEYGINCTPGMYAHNMEIIKRFAALVAAKEREACAQVCDDKAHAVRFLCNESNVIACAAAIRARGNT